MLYYRRSLAQVVHLSLGVIATYTLVLIAHLWKLFPLLKPNVQSLTKYGHEKVQYHSHKTTQHVARQGDSSSKANTVLPVLFDSLCPLWKEKYQGNDSHSSSNYVHPFKITHLTLMPMLGFTWQDLTIQSARWRIVKKIPT